MQAKEDEQRVGEVLKRSAMFFVTDCRQSSELSARSQWSWLRAELS